MVPLSFTVTVRVAKPIVLGTAAAVTVAFALMTKVVGLVMLRITAPAGIPAPEIGCPGSNPVVSAVVTVALAFVVSTVGADAVPGFNAIGLVNSTFDNALPEFRLSAPAPTKPPLLQVNPAPEFRVTVSGVVCAANPPPPDVPPQVIVPSPAVGVVLRSRANVPDNCKIPVAVAVPSTSGLLAGSAPALLTASTPSVTRVMPV